MSEYSNRTYYFLFARKLSLILRTVFATLKPVFVTIKLAFDAFSERFNLCLLRLHYILRARYRRKISDAKKRETIIIILYFNDFVEISRVSNIPYCKK